MKKILAVTIAAAFAMTGAGSAHAQLYPGLPGAAFKCGCGGESSGKCEDGAKAAGAEKLFREDVSSVAPRKQLEAAIEFAREGDTLVVTKIDRLARSVRHLCEFDRLQAKGVALRILNMNLDTNDATGKLMLQIIRSIAEFERSIMLARQLEGIAKAKAKGKYRGGIPTARAKAEQVFASLVTNIRS